MSSCLFCQIAEKKKPSRVVYEDEQMFAFEDINPQAPVHILIVPKRHVPGLDQASQEDRQMLGQLLLVAQKIARDRGIHESGYRLLVNQGPDAGQSVFHMHFHLLGGRVLHWPPG
ncbi:MAG: histidine triad nucleotide-binding protein [Acidobacteriota bacterium]